MRTPLPTIALVAALCAPGCGTLEREELQLSPAQIAQITAAASSQNAESLRKAAESVFEVSVEKLEAKVDAATGAINEIRVTLPAIAKEAASTAGASALDTIARNPTTSGLGAAGLAAFTGVFALWARRSRLRREAKV